MDNVKNDAYYVQSILTDLRFIDKHMQGVTQEKLEDDEIFLNAMMFRLIQIWESAKKLTEEYKASHKTIPWVDIAGLRNRLVHDYGNVDLRVIYLTLSEDIPALIKELEKME